MIECKGSPNLAGGNYARCPSCLSDNVDCVVNASSHWHICFDCGYDGGSLSEGPQTDGGER